MTPPEVMAYRATGTAPDSPGWSLRTVPNKFPALKPDSDEATQEDDLVHIMAGIGNHEVIVESPNHRMNFIELTDEETENVFLSYQNRIQYYRDNSKYQYVMIFKNQGKRAGSSLQHSHSQLIALPVLPTLIHEETEKSRKYYKAHQRCVFCDLIERELSENKRVIFDSEWYVALSPIAPRFPFEMWVLPKHHKSHYEKSPELEIRAFAGFMQKLLKTLNKMFPNVPYNFMLHNAPLHLSEKETYHWHIEIIPRLTKMAGFEHGTGMYINPTSPEIAADCFKEALVK